MNSISADISIIKLWFERAVPNPTDKSRAVQIGCHYEEVSEMVDAIPDPFVNCHDPVEMIDYARFYKVQCPGVDSGSVNRKDLLDALCDQIVTAVGVAHMFGMDIAGALSEVNRSNFSKFVDGQPLFDENGKIKKGANYTPPNLEPYL